MDIETPPPSDANAKPASEPIFKIPFVPLVVGLGLVGLYAAQPTLARGGMELALAPADVEAGHLLGVLTHMIVHGGWAHVLMNAFAVIAFGTPVARAFNKNTGAIGWLAFFILCGVIAGLGYSLVHWGSMTPVIGASGAAFGLIGASLRLQAGPGILIPITYPHVLKGAAMWMGVNVLTGLMGGALTGGQGGIAWEAHAIGFVAGIVLIRPFYRLFSRFDGRTIVPR